MRHFVVCGAVSLQIWSAPVIAQPREFQCTKAFAEMAPEYPKLVCAGNDLLERGKPKRALELYLLAAQVPFFESPNFLIYYRIASAQGALGDRTAATQTLRQFANMLAIYEGAKACAEMTALDSKAAEVMCSEAFSPDAYRGEAGLRLRKQVVGAYRERAFTLKRTYGLQLP